MPFIWILQYPISVVAHMLVKLVYHAVSTHSLGSPVPVRSRSRTSPSSRICVRLSPHYRSRRCCAPARYVRRVPSLPEPAIRDLAQPRALRLTLIVSAVYRKLS
ncbi:hypothetical protein J6590_013305 [Homalodisca vitripennis]|nr:hypothetical protein J6590_013305 [Homalodisca vitripennis]